MEEMCGEAPCCIRSESCLVCRLPFDTFYQLAGACWRRCRNHSRFHAARRVASRALLALGALSSASR